MLFCSQVFGQRQKPTTRMFSMNMTPLLTMLIPFNRTNPKVTGPYMIQTAKYRGNNFSRFALGVDLDEQSDPEQRDSYFNLRLGWGKQRQLHDRLTFWVSGDAMLSLGDLNILGTKSENGLKIGGGPTWGVQYKIAKGVSLGTETSLFFGIDVDDFTTVLFEFVPPVSLFFNLELPTKAQKARP